MVLFQDRMNVYVYTKKYTAIKKVEEFPYAYVRKICTTVSGGTITNTTLTHKGYLFWFLPICSQTN